MATTFQCIKILFKSNIALNFLLDYALISLLKYFLFLYLCEEPVKNASKKRHSDYTNLSIIFLKFDSMKKIIFSFLLLSLSVSAQSDNGLSDARALAEQGIIVNQSALSPVSNPSFTTDIQEASMYRLYDTIIRQEVLGIALKIRGVYLPDSYTCRGYYRDTAEWWVCRAAELSADQGIITRANLRFRPHDTLTLAEALGITIKALNIPLSTTPTSTIGGSEPDWQKRLVLTIAENHIALNIRDTNGQ